jgi:hypothetical protein
VDAAAAQPGQLPEPQPGTEQTQHVVPPEQRDLGQQPTGLLRDEGPPLGLSQRLFEIGSTPGRGHLAHWIGVDGAFVHGELQDPQHERPALHEGGVAGAASEVSLPTTKVGRADPHDRLLPEPGAHVQPQAALGHRQGGGTPVRVSRPHLPPLVGPPAEGKPAPLEPLPGAAGNTKALPSDQVARLILRGDGLGPLGAIVQEPPHLVGDATSAAADPLADPCRRHCPCPPTSCPAARSAHGPARPPTASTPSRDSSSPTAQGRLASAGSCRRQVWIWPGTAGVVLVG